MGVKQEVPKYLDVPVLIPVEIPESYPVEIPIEVPVDVPMKYNEITTIEVDQPYPVEIPVKIEVPIEVPVAVEVPLYKDKEVVHVEETWVPVLVTSTKPHPHHGNHFTVPLDEVIGEHNIGIYNSIGIDGLVADGHMIGGGFTIPHDKLMQGYKTGNGGITIGDHRIIDSGNIITGNYDKIGNVGMLTRSHGAIGDGTV